MTDFLEVILTVIVLMNFMLLAFKRLSGCIRLVAVQGVLIGLLPVLFSLEDLSIKTFVVSFVTIFLKGAVFPFLFFHAMKKAKIHEDIEPYLGYKVSVFVGLFALIVSFWISRKLIIPVEVSSPLVLPASFFTILVGLFMIISRAKAITQALSYLVAENGIAMFSYAFLIEQPFVVELGILLDVFVGVFVMGITIFHIKQQFDHVDTRYLSQLKD